ncbi:site-specific integrase [Geodermatophilus sp. URMC 62]|uniref:site-specific integrase n=1 Tax=Geodermatophilus sp. URMC 62 TaxID=3423414 RepID=UPI00406CB66F
MAASTFRARYSPGRRTPPWWTPLLATGLRRGEALALHWPDVDLDAGLLRVRWTLSRTSQGLRLEEPKTDKSRRTVSLPRSAIEALRAHRTRQLEEQRAAAGAWQEQGLVFTTEIGTPLEPRNVLRRFEFLAERAGLRGVTLHTLRPLRGQLPAGGRHAHQGRPGAPGPLVVRHHGRHLQPRRSRPAAGSGRPARPGAPLVTAAVPRAALLYALL